MSETWFSYVLTESYTCKNDEIMHTDNIKRSGSGAEEEREDCMAICVSCCVCFLCLIHTCLCKL